MNLTAVEGFGGWGCMGEDFECWGGGGEGSLQNGSENIMISNHQWHLR